MSGELETIVVVDPVTEVVTVSEPGPQGPSDPLSVRATVEPSGALSGLEAASAQLGLPVVGAQGMTVRVGPFALGQWTFAGGAISVPAAGTWFIGAELWSGALRCLPRLGHRGWVPVARVVASSGAITSITQIMPAMPASRIPRTLKKLNDGASINVVVMGSSLTVSGGAATDWPGMIFGSGSIAAYRLPGVIAAQYRGVGGAPNQYQLAQVGLASKHWGYGFANSGFAITGEPKFPPPNGRSAMLTGVDLVVIGVLANGGDYRLESIEPIVRKLRQRGVEVILVTDNPQGPSTDYAAMSAASLYVDGPEVMRIADLYGVELADTAGYVFEAHIRSGGTGIYGDTIHMTTGTPSGPAALLPANGHEAWARAVRSIFSIRYTPAVPTVTNNAYDFAWNFNDWATYGASSSLALSAGRLVVTTSGAASGGWVIIPGAIQVGDTVTVTYDASSITGGNWQIGLQGTGWASNAPDAVAGTAQQVTLVATQAVADVRVLFYRHTGAGTITLDNVTVSVSRAGAASFSNAVPDRPAAVAPLPPIRMVSDFKTPGDAFVILPADEQFVGTGTDVDRGTLGAHPWGSNSFARCWSSVVGASQDLLTLAVGKKAALSGPAPVGYAMIHYRDPADGPCTVEVRINNGAVKTLNIGTVPFANEWFLPIYTPTELNAATPTPAIGSAWDSISLHVTSGTLKIAALIALGADIDFVSPEQMSYLGTWLPRENSRSGIPGRPTDSAGAYAFLKCTGNRVVWIVSGNPGTKLCEVGSGSELIQNLNYAGNYHIFRTASTRGPGETHFIRCIEANASGSQANGRALHVGGAYVINDR